MQLDQCISQVRAQIAEACARSGRDPGEVRLVAVSKTVGIDQVGRAIELGQDVFGENRIEVMEPKAAQYPSAHWHFIGNIQKRKIARIVQCAELVHSVDRMDIVPKMDRSCAEAGKVQDILVEVNVSGEQTKSGFRPSEVADALRGFGCFEHLRVKGLMTMAPQGSASAARSTFRGLKSLQDALLREKLPKNVEPVELSMGMSEDFEIAIEEGATIVRVGRGVFGGLQ